MTDENVILYKATRSDLPDALRGLKVNQFQSISLSEAQKLAKNEIVFGYWEDAFSMARAVPAFIVLEKDKLKEFFAWLNTYVSAAGPVTQWCRVLTADELEDYRYGEGVNIGLGKLSPAWVGAVIGECVVQADKLDARNSLTYLACQATYTFSVARALAVWGPKYSWAYLGERIDRCHSILQSSPRRIGQNFLEYVWSVLGFLDGANAPLRRAELTKEQRAIAICFEDLIELGTLSNSGIQSLIKYFPPAESLPALDELTAEQRVMLLDAMAREIESASSQGTEKQRVAEFVIAYIASRVGGGWRNIDLTREWFHIAPLAPIWFGVIHALIEPDIFGSNFDGLSRLLLRDLETRFDLYERPRCDVSLEELGAIVLPNSGNKISARTVYSRAIQIELVPGICALVSMEPRREAVKEALPPARLQYSVHASETTSGADLVARIGRLEAKFTDMVNELLDKGVLDFDGDSEEKRGGTSRRGKRSLKIQKKLF